MTDYEKLFAEVTPTESVFADKSALDPLTPPSTIKARSGQQRQLARILTGISTGFLPPTVSIYGPPGTGKTLTARQITTEFANRTNDLAAEYVNLKETASIFSAVNEICATITGDKREAYQGIDGVFDAVWTGLESYPEWTVIILDEIDQIRLDPNYDPNEFLYRLLRGEGKLARGINLSLFLVSNKVVQVDVELDSRVRSAMSDTQIFFPPYSSEELYKVVADPVATGFKDGAVSEAAFHKAVEETATRWGDARRALRLFRRAGEWADEHDLGELTPVCIYAALAAPDTERVREKLQDLSLHYIIVLFGITARSNPMSGEIIQPVTTTEIASAVQEDGLPDRFTLSPSRIREIVRDLETMGLADTWIDSRGRGGRVMQIETTFDPEVVRETTRTYLS